jgi:hypothetical protein
MKERRRKPRAHRRARKRPFMIEADDFDFMDDCELSDWMYGNPSIPESSG